jgi:hypothetical protein
MTKALLLLYLGWALFMFSLALPAVTIDMGAWPDIEVVPGFWCLLLASHYYPSNGLMLFSPVLMHIRWFRSNPGRKRVMAGLFLASFFWSLVSYPGFHIVEGISSIHAGYVLWVLSFPIVAAGMGMKDAVKRTRGAGDGGGITGSGFKV